MYVLRPLRIVNFGYGMLHLLSYQWAEASSASTPFSYYQEIKDLKFYMSYKGSRYGKDF